MTKLSMSEEEMLKRKYTRPYEKSIADLEKENAELKDDNKVMADNYSKMEQKFYDNLTKAKEIIKTFLGFAETFGYSPSMDKFISEAEQFLNCSEKPNNYHSKEEQELNLHNALTDYCDM